MTLCFQLKIYYMDDLFLPNVCLTDIFSMNRFADFLNVLSGQHLILFQKMNPASVGQ